LINADPCLHGLVAKVTPWTHMNQNENKPSFTTAVLILASWACTSSAETGDASGGAGQAPTGNAGSPSSGAGLQAGGRSSRRQVGSPMAFLCVLGAR